MEYFSLQDIEKALIGIPTLEYSEKELVREELMKKFRPDYRLTKYELVQTIMDLVYKYKISEHDKNYIFQRFEMSDEDVRRHRH